MGTEITILQGDCREVLATLPAASIDACVTDPPYGLEFMNKGWDAPWRQAQSRGLPGARDGVALPTWKSDRNPKCLVCRKQKRGAKKCRCACPQWDETQVQTMTRQMRHFQDWTQDWASEVYRVLKPGAHLAAFGGTRTFHRVAVAIEDAGFEIRDTLCWLYGSGFPKSHNQPGGWGTALKPAWEPIILARKPLVGTVAGNMAAHGTGALNIDGCRVAGDVPSTTRGNSFGRLNDDGWQESVTEFAPNPAGRWPANVAHDGSDEVLEAFARFGERTAGRDATPRKPGFCNVGEDGTGRTSWPAYGDTGTAARFFYCGKATKEERGDGNGHPTVKPLSLMKWLCRLITPPGGTVLDPFLGSGSTAIAAEQEGFHCIGIEQSAEYLEIARSRLSADAPLLTEVA